MQDAFAVVVCHESGHPTVRISGEIDLTNADTVTEAFRALAGVGERKVDLDFGAVTFMDSTGIRALLEGLRVGLELHVVAASERVRRVLEIAGVDILLDDGVQIAVR